MYCSNCGNKIDNGSNFCPKCGNKIGGVYSNVTTGVEVANKDSKMKIVSIVLGSIGLFNSMMIILAPIGLIMTTVGLILAFCSLKKGKNLPGILLNSIGLVVALIFCILFLIFFSFAMDNSQKERIDVDDYYFEDEFNYDNSSDF